MSTDCPLSSSRVLRLYVINEASASPQTLDTAIFGYQRDLGDRRSAPGVDVPARSPRSDG
jgi:hypothetical protein